MKTVALLKEKNVKYVDITFFTSYNQVKKFENSGRVTERINLIRELMTVEIQ